jgi:hypothetical protein
MQAINANLRQDSDYLNINDGSGRGSGFYLDEK